MVSFVNLLVQSEKPLWIVHIYRYHFLDSQGYLQTKCTAFWDFFFVFFFNFLTFSWIDKLHCSLPSLLSLGGGLGRILYLWLLIIKQYNNQPPTRGKTHILISPKCPHNLFFLIFFPIMSKGLFQTTVEVGSRCCWLRKKCQVHFIILQLLHFFGWSSDSVMFNLDPNLKNVSPSKRVHKYFDFKKKN